MASTYTDIGTELMATGENAGNWGTKTNVNIQILEEAIRGYVAQSIAGGAQTTALTYSDGSTGDSARNAVVALTGTITGNQVVTVTAKEKWWIIDNQTSGAYTVQVLVSGQTGVTWATTDKGTKILYCNGTDVVDTGISSNILTSGTGDITLDSAADIVVDAAGGNVEFKDAGTTQLTLDMDGTAGAQILKLGVDSDDLVFQQYDGNEVMRIADNRKVYFYDEGGEHISSDGTDFTFASGNDINLTATTDINVPANVGVTFGDDGEKIEGDGTDLTISASADLNLTATTDINIPANVGLTFGNDGEKIEGDGTDMTVTANNFNVDAGADIILDADGGDIFFKDAGTTFGSATNTSGNLIIKSGTTTAITFSGANATVAGNLSVGGDFDVTGSLDFSDADITNVGSIALDSITNDGTDITLDSSNDIVIDAAGGNIEFKDAGTLQLSLDMDGTAGVQIIKLGVDSDDLVFQQYDGNEVMRINDDRKVYFYDDGGEHISSDGTDFTFASGNDINLTATTDINVPANVGITFGDDAEKIEGDGTDLTISGNNINLTATADVNIPSGVGLTFATAEKIESDGTDLSITVGSNGDINIPANIGMTFGDDGEKIEGDGTDLTIASSAALNLTATTDVVIPANVGITFGTGEKIEGDSTDLTITSGAKINLTATSDVIIPSGVGLVLDGSGDEKIESDGTDISISVGSNGDINVPANVGVTFGDDGEKIEGDGTDLTISASALATIDAGTDITLDAGGGDIFFKDDGTTFGSATNTSGNLIIKSGTTTAATFSGANVTFAGTIAGGGTLTTGGNVVIPDAGNIGSASDTDAIAIASNGAVTFSQTPVFPDGSIAVADLDIDGATDIGAAIVDADLFIVDDGAGGTNRKVAASRIVTYIDANSSAATVGKAIAMAIVFG